MLRKLMASVTVMAALALPAVSWAHGGHAHKVMGTIAAVTANQLDVKATDGKTVTIALDAKTVYLQGKTKVDAKMLKVGERIVVEAEQPAGAKVMTAKTVQMARTTAAAAKTETTHSH